jgi:hypothetical protein
MVLKKNTLNLASAILGSAYLCYLVFHYAGLRASTVAEAETIRIMISLVIPHVVLVLTAVVFNWTGWMANRMLPTILSGLIYGLSALVLPVYAPFVAAEFLLCFAASAAMRWPDTFSFIEAWVFEPAMPGTVHCRIRANNALPNGGPLCDDRRFLRLL